MTYRSAQLLLALLLSIAGTLPTDAQAPLDSLLPLRGFCIKAPSSGELPAFTGSIEQELVTRGVNTLVLRVDYNYAYESRPELRDEETLSKAEVKQLVETCRRSGIRLIPQVNLLGHQSWASDLENLLVQYPEFDETPHVSMPEEYEWPNEDGLYCKSYCPLHPGVHAVVFDIMDEIIEVFEADAFHAGMDEVFYIGDDQCPRCAGRDKAELFAGEVTRIRNHLVDQGAELWIWGDRLIDGKTTGIGMWEASMNNTHRAIDLIPKDVVINDWHYERAVPTAALFALKGFRVLSCPWRRPEVAVDQVEQMLMYRQTATPEMKDRYAGVLQTIWTSAGNFMDEFYGRNPARDDRGGSTVECFKQLFSAIENLDER